MLQQRIYAYRSKKKVNYRSQQNEIPDIKKMFPEYKNLHSLVIQDVARRLDKAFDNFFMRVEEKRNGKNIKAGFPRFKSRDRYSSITYTQSGFRILDNPSHTHSQVSGYLTTVMCGCQRSAKSACSCTEPSQVISEHSP
jgi:transposase